MNYIYIYFLLSRWYRPTPMTSVCTYWFRTYEFIEGSIRLCYFDHFISQVVKVFSIAISNFITTAISGSSWLMRRKYNQDFCQKIISEIHMFVTTRFIQSVCLCVCVCVCVCVCKPFIVICLKNTYTKALHGVEHLSNLHACN